MELAIILPVFLLMVLGMIDLARAWNAKQVITDAAREAARSGVVDSTPPLTGPQIEAIALTAIANAGFDASLANVDPQGVGGGVGDHLTVEITYPYEFQFMTLFMSLFGGNTVDLETRIVMRIE